MSIPSLGYMEKLMLRDSEGQSWLLKYPGSKYPSDALNEKICYEVSKIYGVPHQRVELCIDDEGRVGCICKNFLKQGDSIIHGGRLLGHVLKLDTSSPKFGFNTDKAYTLQLILSVLHGDEIEFITSVLFDNTVGNIDRHDKNWAKIEHNDLTRKLAIGYDYGLSFYATKETGSTWFQDIGFEENGVTSFNNLFFKLCVHHRDIVDPYMRIMEMPDIDARYEKIIQNVPSEFKSVSTHQLDFLRIRRFKMLNVWRDNSERKTLS